MENVVQLSVLRGLHRLHTADDPAVVGGGATAGGRVHSDCVEADGGAVPCVSCAT